MPRIIWGPGWLESLSLLLGALILSDHGKCHLIGSIASFCKWFYHCLCLKFCFDKYFFCCIFKPTILKPVRLSNYKLTEHGQILIWRLSARFDFLLPSYYGVNRCLSTRLGFQLQVVSTRSSYNPETIIPVWFDYESPVLYMVKPAFITTRYGLS